MPRKYLLGMWILSRCGRSSEADWPSWSGGPMLPQPRLFCSHPQATFLSSLIKYTPLTYNKKYLYPWWGDALGWLLALSSMICIPAWSCYKLSTLKGSFREVGSWWGGKQSEDELGSPCCQVAACLGRSWHTGGPGTLVWGQRDRGSAEQSQEETGCLPDTAVVRVLAPGEQVWRLWGGSDEGRWQTCPLSGS